MRTRVPTRLVSGWCALCLLSAAPAWAQGVSWHDDYARARQEAADKARPLLIDFGSDNCFWCKQLDARTFAAPAVVGLLNDRFVALRVNAQQNPRLTEALHIGSFPTLVFAAPDGKILGYQEGFLEASALAEQLHRVLAAVTPPDWMQ